MEWKYSYVIQFKCNSNFLEHISFYNSVTVCLLYLRYLITLFPDRLQADHLYLIKIFILYINKGHLVSTIICFIIVAP